MNAQRIIDAISPLMTLCLNVTMLCMFGRLTKLATLAIASEHFVALFLSPVNVSSTVRYLSEVYYTPL